MSTDLHVKPSATTDTYRAATRQLLRDRLFDAARGALAERPWAEITMAQVARGAGVSRQTVYNECGSRDEFAQAFVIREGEAFITAVEAAIEANRHDPTAALGAALSRFLALAASDPLVGMLVAEDGTGGMLPLVTTRSGPILAWASTRIADAILREWPALHARDAKLLSEALVRLAISYATAPGTDAAQASADTVRLLSPFIERAIAAAAS